MGAPKKYAESLVGQWARPDGVEGGPFAIESIRHDGITALVRVISPKGIFEYRIDECRITKKPEA